MLIELHISVGFFCDSFWLINGLFCLRNYSKNLVFDFSG